MAYTFTAKNGRRVQVPEDALTGMGLDDLGICAACGAERGGVEPDARNYPCDDCDEMAVYGCQELMMAGLIS